MFCDLRWWPKVPKSRGRVTVAVVMRSSAAYSSWWQLQASAGADGSWYPCKAVSQRRCMSSSYACSAAWRGRAEADESLRCRRVWRKGRDHSQSLRETCKMRSPFRQEDCTYKDWTAWGNCTKLHPWNCLIQCSEPAVVVDSIMSPAFCLHTDDLMGRTSMLNMLKLSQPPTKPKQSRFQHELGVSFFGTKLHSPAWF